MGSLVPILCVKQPFLGGTEESCNEQQCVPDHHFPVYGDPCKAISTSLQPTQRLPLLAVVFIAQ